MDSGMLTVLVILAVLMLVLVVLAVLVLAKQKAQQASFAEVVDRLGRLEADKEAAARIGIQSTETYNASKQLLAGFSAVQGQLTDFANGQRVAGEAIHKGNVQAAERFQEQTAGLNDRFTGLQRALLDKADQRNQELDAKLAAYRREVESKLQANGESVQQLIQRIEARFTTLSNINTEAIEKLKGSVEAKLAALQADNTAKLEEMRRTVDEKLQATLQTRLTESFKQVSERLEQVHRGLGEMQTLASGVGDLKRVLTNVKTRGTWGEMQLSRLLEQMLTSEQYMANVATKKGSGDRVEFAIRLPGKEDGVEVFLPIDAKFPIEDYQRLLDAQDRADLPAIDEAAKALETRIKGEARKISDKYIDPPNTTDFALLYLPIEGLYAEVLRRPGLIEMLQRDHRVTVAGPTTLTAILNSLQMGFRTLAITKRSSEVWKVLGAVKTEFGKFGDAIEAAKKKIEAASRQFDQVDVRTRAIQRKLRGVEELPAPAAQEMLDVSAPTTVVGDDDEGSEDFGEKESGGHRG